MNAAVLEKPILENNAVDGWPSSVDMKVIDPGVVFYEDLTNSRGEHVGGNVLVQKAALDRMAASMNGKPIINWDHRTVRPAEYGKGKFQGIITDVYYNAADGWYHARGYVWDEATKKNIENGYSISCAYQVSEWGEGGAYHKVPYEKEVVNGSYTHIAVVPIPRYEGARIELLNSAKGAVMNLLKIFSKDKPEEKIELDMATTKVAVEGHGDVALVEMINSYMSDQKKKMIANKMDEMSVIIDGKEVSVKELKNSFLHNAEAGALSKAHEAGDHKGNVRTNCSLCNSAASHEPTNLKEKAGDLPKVYNADDEKKKKEDEERKNAEEAKKKEDEEKKNALSNAAKLDEARNKERKLDMPEIGSISALMKEGQNRYGSAKPAATATK